MSLKIHCPTCEKERFAKHEYTFETTTTVEEDHGSEGYVLREYPYETYDLYRCKKCKQLIITLYGEYFPDDIGPEVVFPLPLATKLIDQIADNYGASEDVCKDFYEADRCFRSNLVNAFAGMARRTVYSVCQEKGAKGKKIKDRILSLQTKAVLTEEAAELAREIVKFGDFGVHPEWKPLSQRQAKEGFRKLCAFIRLVYKIPAPVHKPASWNTNERRYSLR